jgi:PAP2 superfamily
MRMLAAIASILLTAITSLPSQAHESCKPGVLESWNERVIALAEAEDKLLTLKGVRTAAMMHIAMHDALNSIQRRYSAYAFSGNGAGAHPQAAAAQAAYEVVVSQYPRHESELASALKNCLAHVPEGPAKQRALELGKGAAAKILAQRDGDGWNTEAAYHFQPMSPGVYAEFHEHSGTPQGFVFGAGWAAVKPFAMKSPDQFRSPPPPDINSDEYTAAFNEVKEKGRFASQARTADQTHLAMWWKDFAENSQNRLARSLVASRHTDLWSAARLFAWINMGIFDGYISSFDSKFHYNHWRPFTAIRWAEHDGNARTAADVSWNNTHKHTYPWPSYPSAHGTACGVAMSAFSSTYGNRTHFTMETREVDAAGPMSPKIAMHPATRSFDSFSAAAMECAMSRVYLGIHFRYDSVMGNKQGTQLGDYITQNFLTPVK